MGPNLIVCWRRSTRNWPLLTMVLLRHATVGQPFPLFAAQDRCDEFVIVFFFEFGEPAGNRSPLPITSVGAFLFEFTDGWKLPPQIGLPRGHSGLLHCFKRSAFCCLAAGSPPVVSSRTIDVCRRKAENGSGNEVGESRIGSGNGYLPRVLMIFSTVVSDGLLVLVASPAEHGRAGPI